mgnify:CR=1 FL=1
MNRDGFPWSADIDARTAFLDDDVMKSLDLSSYSHARYEESLKKTPHLPDETAEEYRRREIAYLNIKWFMQTLLDRMDRTSMYSGLEARVPFADHRIIDYVYNVPWKMKYQNGVEKALLRDAFRDLLPPELLHRKKSPYPKTYHPGYEKILIARMTDILADSNAPILPLIDKKKAKNSWKHQKNTESRGSGSLWLVHSFWPILSSSITGWRNIIFLCDRKKHSGTFTLSGVFFVYYDSKTFLCFF